MLFFNLHFITCPNTLIWVDFLFFLPNPSEIIPIKIKIIMIIRLITRVIKFDTITNNIKINSNIFVFGFKHRGDGLLATINKIYIK